MNFLKTPLEGSYLIKIEQIEDERGFFARSFCLNEFRAMGLEINIAQCNVSFTKRRGTLRGLHYQSAPHEETKLVRCINGSIWDVIVDLRRNSATFGQWYSVELSSSNRLALYIPEGFAHGFQTLIDNTEVEYYMSEYFHADFAKGINWRDPSLAISWPLNVTDISLRDQSFPMLVESGPLT